MLPPQLSNWKEGDSLPNSDQAEISRDKFEKYLLNPDHPDHDHGNKWKPFSDIGYDVFSPDGRAEATNEIVEQIRLQLSQAAGNFDDLSKFGVRITTDIILTGPNAKNLTLRTVWQYSWDETHPKLITAIPRLHK